MLVLVKPDFERTAASSLRAGIAVLDGDGVIRWANHAWSRAEGADLPLFGGAGVGSNLVTLTKTGGRPLSDAIHSAITAVISGASSYVELQAEPAARGAPVGGVPPTRGGR